MDPASLTGLVLGLGMFFWSMLDVSDNDISMFVDPASLVIVLGGSMACTMVAMPLREVINVAKVLKKIFLHQAMSMEGLMNEMVDYAELARRDGILALEGVVKDIEFEFLVKGVKLAVDGTDPDLIENILETDLEYLEERHKTGKLVLDLLGKYAPAMGMCGTLIGLVAMLQNLSDPSSLGPSMAVALITTLYGALFANLLFLPMSDKLNKRSGEEKALRQMVIKGVMSIQQGDNPRVVKQKLMNFLAPNERPDEDE